MKLLRALAVPVVLVALVPAGALAQSKYPDQPIKLIVPYTPGGGTDVVTRLVAERISANNKGWTFVVDNKPGAGGNIGMDAVAKAKPDGYTIGMGQTGNLAINPTLYSSMPFDALKDFVPIALVAEQPLIVAVPAASPWKTLADLVAEGKKKPLMMASAANGTVGHLAGEMFARRAGFTITHVPYKGAGPALTDLMGGRTEFMLPSPPAALQLIKGGKLRALAVTSAKRMASLPDVPTIDESGYKGFAAIDWKGLVAPAGTPPAVIAQLRTEVEKALKQKETLERLAADGSAPMSATPEQTVAFIKAEHARWGAIVREASVKPD
jgi:tripartite-type tricarboxylate transporter receptor subunit TctC